MIGSLGQKVREGCLRSWQLNWYMKWWKRKDRRENILEGKSEYRGPRVGEIYCFEEQKREPMQLDLSDWWGKKGQVGPIEKNNY